MKLTKEQFMEKVRQDRIKKEKREINEKYKKRFEEKKNSIPIADRYKIERINKSKKRKKQQFAI